MKKNNILEEGKFRRSIMRRVYAIWLVRKIFSPVFVKLYLLVFLSVQFLNSVSIINVLENAPGAGNFAKNFYFFSQAFIGTDVWVKLILIFGAALLIWFGKDLAVTRLRQERAHLSGV
jgi:hypothetical protein